MRSSVWMAALALVAVGCRVEGAKQGRPAATVGQAEDSVRMAPGVGHSVFDRRREVVAPGLARLTVSAIVRMDHGPDSALKVIDNLMADAKRSDTTAAAIRVLAYLPPTTGHGDSAGAQRRSMTLIPLAFSDWAPEPGFDSLSVATRRHAYKTETHFVHDAATLRSMGMGEGVGPLKPGVPRGQVPPGHPAPPVRP